MECPKCSGKNIKGDFRRVCEECGCEWHSYGEGEGNNLVIVRGKFRQTPGSFPKKEKIKKDRQELQKI